MHALQHSGAVRAVDARGCRRGNDSIPIVRQDRARRILGKEVEAGGRSAVAADRCRQRSPQPTDSRWALRQDPGAIRAGGAHGIVDGVNRGSIRPPGSARPTPRRAGIRHPLAVSLCLAQCTAQGLAHDLAAGVAAHPGESVTGSTRWSERALDARMTELVELSPQKSRVEPAFGRGVAVLGKSIIVTSPPAGDTSTAGGSAHVFGDTRSGWRRTQRLFSSSPEADDRFGSSVAASGSRLVIGRDRADEGATDGGGAIVFRRVGLHFRPEAELSLESPGDGDEFGCAVAMDGTRVVVGASRDDDIGLDAGSADVFDLVDDRWTRSAHLLAPDGAAADWFGHAVAVQGDLVVIGAYGDDDRGEKSGAAYVWRASRTGREVTWTLEAKLAPDDLAAGDWFGFACAVDGVLLAIGAPRDDDIGESAGCVRVFRRRHDEWKLDAVLHPPTDSVTAWFGYSLALRKDRLVVGAPGQDAAGESSGCANLYERDADGWTLVASLQPQSAQEESQAGASVALSPSYVAIGQLWQVDGEPTSGHAWVFGPRRDATPAPPDAAPRDAKQSPAGRPGSGARPTDDASHGEARATGSAAVRARQRTLLPWRSNEECPRGLAPAAAPAHDVASGRRTCVGFSGPPP